jgi:intracellular multiplication protein IcmL
MSDDIQENNKHKDAQHAENGQTSAEDAPVENNAPADSPAEDTAAESQKDPMLNQIPEDIFTSDERQAAAPTPESQTSEAPAASSGNDTPAEKPPAQQNAPASQAPASSPASTAAAPSAASTEKPKKKFQFKSGGLGSNSPAKETPAPQSKQKPAGGQKATAGQDNIPRGALNAVVSRNEYYRDGYRSLMKVAFIEGIIIVSLVLVFLVYMNIHEGRDRYFATTADGRILQLVPLDQPNMSSAALMSWVSQAATEVMTFGFHDYQRRLQEASRHFTRRGWESFTTALQRSRIIESVETLQQVVTATPRSAPVLLQEGVFNGRHRWIVKLPLTVTFKSGNKTQSTNLEVTITIERVPTLESPNGVGIESWVAV